MDLIPTLSLFQALAAIPLVVMLGPRMLEVFHAIMAHPLMIAFLNTTLVFLKATKAVWKPALNYTQMVLTPVMNTMIHLAPIVKDVLLQLINTTGRALRVAQSMGMSFTHAFPSILRAVKDIGEALITLTRGIGHVSYYVLRGLSLVITSVESVFLFGRRVVFETHLLTLDDIYNVMLPIAVLLSILAVSWLRKSHSSVSMKSDEVYQPRRSSRIQRKRAMLCGADMSYTLSAGKKSSPVATNL